MNEEKFIERLKQAASECRGLANGYKNLSPTRRRLSIELAKSLLDEAEEAANEPDPVAFAKAASGYAVEEEKADGEFPLPLPSRL